MSVTQDSYIKLRHTIESVPQGKKKNSLEIRPGEEFLWSCLWDCLQTDEDAVHLRDRHTVSDFSHLDV